MFFLFFLDLILGRFGDTFYCWRLADFVFWAQVGKGAGGVYFKLQAEGCGEIFCSRCGSFEEQERRRDARCVGKRKVEDALFCDDPLRSKHLSLLSLHLLPFCLSTTLRV